MEAKLLHHLGVPCIASIRDFDKNPYQEDKIFYLNPEAIIRYEPEGATIIPPMFYSSFLWVDEDLANLLKRKGVQAKGVPRGAISLLLENKVILENQSSRSFREFHVDVSGLPTQVLLDVTSACTCNCVACYHTKDLIGHMPSIEDLKRRIAKLRQLGLGLFEVTGGEPFLRDDLNLILSYIYDLGLHFYVVTNGELLTSIKPEMINILKRGLGVAVSLDGVGALHDGIRQNPGLYDKLIRGLDLLFLEGIQIYLISTINEINIGCISEMIQVAKKYETTLHIRPTIRTGNALINNLGSVDLREQLQPFLRDENVRNGLLSTKKSIPLAKYYGCGIRKRISVNSKGLLYPCVMDRDSSCDNIKNYTRENLVKTLKTETSYFLDAHNKCRECGVNQKQDIVCGGFCRFSNSYAKGIKP
ncbi:MAG: radical SAM protein [bacterium]